ncbi:hypothetical protein [Corynebacterium nuruki]|uniref:hypothetical protein n=1 Tax=Corynebacterium nuruki TaxID=1032851 RepID=UPI0039BF77A7
MAADVADVVEELRGRITRITGEPADPAAPAAPSPARPVDGVPVPAWLGRHLRRGGLPRSAVTAATDCPAALVDLLAGVTAAGGCAAVVGYPALALGAVAAAGGDLDRLVIVPDPAPHAVAVLGTLVEGLDLVLYRPAKPVAPTAARPVDARLRRSRCALAVCGGPRVWPGSRLHLDWRVDGVTGLGHGSGRIRGVELSGRAWGQGQPPTTFRTVLGAGDTAAAGAAPEARLALQERAL